MHLSTTLLPSLLALGITACGSNSASSVLKQVPLNGESFCDSDVAVPGDPHAMVHATRAVLNSQMKNLVVMEFSTRALNLGTGREIFRDIYREKSNVYAIRISNADALELYTPKFEQAVGSLDRLPNSADTWTLRINSRSYILTCRSTSHNTASERNISFSY